MHTTLLITQRYKSQIRANKTRYCQETTQPIAVPSYTTMEMYVLNTTTHHFSNIFLVGLWQEPCFVRFAKYSPFDFTALCSDTFAVSVLQLYLKIVIHTHDLTFQDINLQPYFEIACVKSVLWPVLNSNVVDVSLSGGSLGYWTAFNNCKRYCTLPYCDTCIKPVWHEMDAFAPQWILAVPCALLCAVVWANCLSHQNVKHLPD